MSWNYRRVTWVHNEGVRFFGVTEVFYDRDKIKVISWIDPNDLGPLTEWETAEDLDGTYKLIGDAFTKPILDLDSFAAAGELLEWRS